MTTARPTFQAPFVRNDYGALAAAIVVPPSDALPHAQPLHGEAHAILERAAEQFGVFVSRLTALGVTPVVLEDVSAAPLGPHGGDAAVLFPDGAFVMRPSDVRARGALAAMEAALEAAQVPIAGRIAAPGLLDGGDVLLANGTLYVGVPAPRSNEVGIPRSVHGNALGREQLAAYAREKGYAVVEIAMAAEVRRLRSVAALLDENTVLCAPGLIDADAFGSLERIVAPRGEDYAAGVLVAGPRRVIANLRFRETIPLLRRSKVAVDAIDLWEFGKTGATPSSMTLALKRA